MTIKDVPAGHDFDADRLIAGLSKESARLNALAYLNRLPDPEPEWPPCETTRALVDVLPRGHRVTWTETVRKTAVFYYGVDEQGLFEPDGSVNDVVVEMLVGDLEDEPPDTEELVERTIESVEVLA